MTKLKTGVVLINLGTPDSPDKQSVRRFLKEFLSDPRVIDLPTWVRKILLNLVILPFRSAQTAKAYKQIWDSKRGSPLLFYSQDLAIKVQQVLGEDYLVEIGMRYGQLNIPSAIDKLLRAGCEKIIALPLFPHYSSAATGSAMEAVFCSLIKKWNIPEIKVLRQFYQEPAYLSAQAKLIQPFLQNQPDKVLFSYHSLPERHIHKSGSNCPQSCFKNEPCPDLTVANRYCYRAACFRSARLLADHLGLGADQYEVVFQSRLGRTVWIGPDTQSRLTKLFSKGVRNLVIVCPSFVTDCLETLEEMGIRAKKEWEALGGHNFTLVPSLNSDSLWVDAVVSLARGL